MTEILAPVGNTDMLDAALAAGCDAVYFALRQFGARAGAKNFTLSGAKEAIDRCHLLGVKVHVTMNTIMYEDEIREAYENARALHKMGVDALIVQDLGFIHLLHKRLPNLEIHASTQMSIMTSDHIEKLKKLGVRRVVLARECSLEQIRMCKRSGLEVEVFVHGAMCICFSGQCYFSSVRYGRSGNRGTCAQPCRMPYELLQDGKGVPVKGKYLLSPKDLSLIDHLNELDVDSLKIEGRMKSVEYVYEAVRQVKMVLQHKNRTHADIDGLKMAFHRGYTLGHTYDQRGYDLMNTKTCNHQGIEIGRVIQVDGCSIRIRLSRDLYQNDGIRFDTHLGCRVNFLYDSDHLLKKHVPAGDIAYVEGPEGVKKGSIVLKTVSYKLEEKVSKAIKDTVRKVPVSLKISCAGIGQPLCAYANDGQHSVYVQSDMNAVRARTRNTDETVIIKQFSKTKFSWVDFNITCYLADSIFFSLGTINALRRDVIQSLEDRRKEVKPVVEQDYEYTLESNRIHPYLYIQKLGDEVAPSSMNITNSYGVAAALEMGYLKSYISDECTLDQIQWLMASFKERYGFDAPVVKTVYQKRKRKLMVMKHCPINTALMDGKRENCRLCHEHTFKLRGKDGSTVLCVGNDNCFMELYDENPQSFLCDLTFLKDLGITNFYVHFIDETASEREAVLNGI